MIPSFNANGSLLLIKEGPSRFTKYTYIVNTNIALNGEVNGRWSNRVSGKWLLNFHQSYTIYVHTSRFQQCFGDLIGKVFYNKGHVAKTLNLTFR